MFTVYILQSMKNGRTYTGSTRNIKDRLYRHDAGQVDSTKHYLPLKLLYSETFQTQKEAKAREIWWKSSSGRKRIKDLFFTKSNNY